MKTRKKVLLFTLCGVATAVVITGAYLLFGSEEAASPVLSTGIQQMADGAYLAASSVVGEPVSFTPEWFDNTLQGGSVTAITVTELPPVTEGVLKLGHGEVSRGQRIPRETLSYLSFAPTEATRSSQFCFVPETVSGPCGYALTCLLKLTDAANCCPEGTKTVTAVSTHESLALAGTLSAEDPEGDAVRFEICSYPTGGTLRLNATSGAFVYTPNEGFTGEDCFTWRAQDENGAFAPAADVRITVRESIGYTFSDMESSANHTHALRVSDAGLMGGEKMGGKHYFHPDRALNRAAFVTILLEAAEIKVPEATDTGYTDDSEIPMGMKGAVKYAKDQGWLGNDTAFRPGEAITRAEAAKIAAAALGLSAPGYHETVEDHAAIPVDVADALYAIYEGGYISTLADGTLAPGGLLTRGDAAKFFVGVLNRTSKD